MHDFYTPEFLWNKIANLEVSVDNEAEGRKLARPWFTLSETILNRNWMVLP